MPQFPLSDGPGQIIRRDNLPLEVQTLLQQLLGSEAPGDELDFSQYLTTTAANAAYGQRWRANTAYLAGDLVLSPEGRIVRRKTDGSSGATYDPTMWDVVADAFYGRKQMLDVRDFGAKGDGRSVTDAAMTSGSAAVTSSTANFAAADVGKYVTVAGALAGPEVLVATIASVQSGTSATLSVSATRTVSGAVMCWSSDDAAAIQAAVNAAGLTGGIVWVPPAVYGIATAVTVPGSVTLQGTGMEYAGTPPTTTSVPVLGSILRAVTNNMGAVVILGAGDGSAFTTGFTGSRLADVIVDGANIAQNAVKAAGRRARLERVQAYYGRSTAFWVTSQNCQLDRCIGGMANVGTTYVLANNDIKLIDCEGRGGSTAQVVITASGCMVEGGHFYQSTLTTPAPDLLINPQGANVADIVISGVTFDGTGTQHVSIIPGANRAVDGVAITGCVFYQVQNAFTDNAGSMVRLDATASSARISAVTITGNAGVGVSSTVRISSIVSAAGAVSGLAVRANTLRFGVAIFGGTTTLADADRGGNAVTSDGTTWKYSSRDGRSTFSGDGTTTSFTIAHGLSTTPANVVVTPGSAAAAAAFYATADATNITVTFTTAPASGVGNVVLNWQGVI